MPAPRHGTSIGSLSGDGTLQIDIDKAYLIDRQVARRRVASVGLYSVVVVAYSAEQDVRRTTGINRVFPLDRGCFSFQPLAATGQLRSKVMVRVVEEIFDFPRR